MGADDCWAELEDAGGLDQGEVLNNFEKWMIWIMELVISARQTWVLHSTVQLLPGHSRIIRPKGMNRTLYCFQTIQFPIP